MMPFLARLRLPNGFSSIGKTRSFAHSQRAGPFEPKEIEYYLVPAKVESLSRHQRRIKDLGYHVCTSHSQGY